MNNSKVIGVPVVIVVQDQAGKLLPGIPVYIGTRYACTDTLGEALYLGMDNGDYELQIITAGFFPVVNKVSITSNRRRYQYVLKSFATGSVSGRVHLVCADIPVVAARICFKPVNPKETGAEEFSLWTDWEGHFDGRNIPAGEYTYTVEAEHCQAVDGLCRIGTDPLVLDVSVDHIPEPVKLTVRVETSDGAKVTKSRVKLLEGMGKIELVAKDGADHYVFEALDKAPFNTQLLPGKLIISPNLVVAADVEGYHTGYVVCNLRYDEECEVLVVCPKACSDSDKTIKLQDQEGKPGEIPLNEALSVEIRGNRVERELKALLPHPGQVKVSAGPNPYNTYLRVFDSTMNPLGQTWNYANCVAEITVETDEPAIFVGVGGDAQDTPGLSSSMQVYCQTIIDPYENNNSFEAALPIRFGETVRPFLFPRNDSDYYAVDVVIPGVLRVRLKESQVATRVCIVDPGRQEVAQTWNYANCDIDISCPVYESGLYRVVVAATDASTFTLSAGSLKVDFIEVGGINEEYTDSPQSIPLAIGKWCGGTIFPARRQFRYRVHTEITGFLKLQMWLPGCACYVAVRNELEKILYSTWNYANTAINGDIPLPSAGDYFVEVRATDEAAASMTNFGLLAHFYPNDEYEGYQSNNTKQTATDIYFGQKVAGCIAVPGDVDIFSFYADHPGLANLQTVPFPLIIRISVSDSKGRPIFDQWDYANVSWNKAFHIPGEGYYFLQVQCTDANAYSSAAYAFILNLQRIKPESAVDGEKISLPLNTGLKFDCLLPGSKKKFTLPVPQPGAVKIGVVAPVSSSLKVTDGSGVELYNRWDYANVTMQANLNLEAPKVLDVSVQTTSADLWSENFCFVYATDGDLPPEPSLAIAGIDDNNRKVLFQVSASPASGCAISKYQLDFTGTGEFKEIKPGLNEHVYDKGGLYAPVLKVTDDRGAVGIDSMFLDLVDVELNRLSCRVEFPGDGAAVTAPEVITARSTTGPGKPVKEMRLYLDGKQVAFSKGNIISFNADWKSLGANEHVIKAEVVAVRGETAEESVRFRLYEIFNLWPQNGTIISGTRAAITWFSPAWDETIAKYRKNGEENWTSVIGARGQQHRVVLEGLEFGVPYEFIAGNGQVFSDPRTISLFKGLSFERPRYGASIPRAYGQFMPVTVKNYSDQPQEVVLECLQPANDELLAGFIGEGSEDKPIHLGPAETRQIELSLSAQDCLNELHRFQVRIRSQNGYSDQAEIEVKVKIPHVDLVWEELEANPNTLSKKLRLTNKGDGLTDLSVRVEPKDAFRLRPGVEHTVLEAGALLELWVDPVLSDGFVQTEGEVQAQSVGKTISQTVTCAVPDGQRVYCVTVDPTFSEIINSWYCTNRPVVDLATKALIYLTKTIIGAGTAPVGNILDKYRSYIGKLFTVTDNKALVRDDNLQPKKYQKGDTIPPGKKIGDDIVIPLGTQAKIIDFRTREVTVNGETVEEIYVYIENFGWTSIKNLSGKLSNETFGDVEPEYLSTDPLNKTVGHPDAKTAKGYSIEIDYKAKQPEELIPKDMQLVVTKASKDGIYVEVATVDGKVLGWTKNENLGDGEDGHKVVTDEKALLRFETTKCVPGEAGEPVNQGDSIIIKEFSQDTEPKGLMVKVASVKTENGKTVEDKELGWIPASQLAPGWVSDIYGPNSTWRKVEGNKLKGEYTGQTTLVRIVDNTGSMEYIAKDRLDSYMGMVTAAAKDGHNLMLQNSFRSYSRQEELWLAKVKDPTKPAAARPGRSNHEDTKADDYNINGGDYSSPLYTWLTQNAPKHGYIRTVPKEPWHWEYRPDEADKLAKEGKYKRDGVNP